MVFKKGLHYPVQGVFVDVVIEKLNNRIAYNQAQGYGKKPNPVNYSVESSEYLRCNKIKTNYKPEPCYKILY
jgi:hypothetical protein